MDIIRVTLVGFFLTILSRSLWAKSFKAGIKPLACDVCMSFWMGIIPGLLSVVSAGDALAGCGGILLLLKVKERLETIIVS
jgi:hypothetical protein